MSMFRQPHLKSNPNITTEKLWSKNPLKILKTIHFIFMLFDAPLIALQFFILITRITELPLQNKSRKLCTIIVII